MWRPMCGRFLNTRPVAEIARICGVTSPLPNYPVRYNIAPTQPVLAVRVHPRTRERSLDALRWGLVPHWAESLAIGARLINARAESAASLPAFRDAFAARRCLIPASGFYEWQRTQAGKQPYAILPARDGELFAFAGLWENWRDRKAGEGAEWVRSCTILTCPANALVAPIHDRMPVILPQAAWPLWLGEAEASPADLHALLTPFPAAAMRAYPIGPRVNAHQNDDAALLDAAG